jgi:hypothetical protein
VFLIKGTKTGVRYTISPKSPHPSSKERAEALERTAFYEAVENRERKHKARKEETEPSAAKED